MNQNEMIHFLECDKQKVLPPLNRHSLWDFKRRQNSEGNAQIIFVTAGFTIFIGPKVDICPVTSRDPLLRAVASAPAPLTSLHTEETDWSGYPIKF